MKTKKKKIILILIFISVVIVAFLKMRKNVETQDDIIFFRLFSSGKAKEEQVTQEKQIETIYLKVDYKNIDFKNVNLLNTTNDIYRKIAPGTSGEFSIILNSNTNLNYQLKFQSENQKPKNLKFSIKGEKKTYKTLEEMEEILKGKILKNQERKITILWKWEYESDIKQDVQDTDDGTKLKNYNFTIYTIGGANET